MAKIFITGSADGLGKAAAETLLSEGHQVVVHVRSEQRAAAVKELLDKGARLVIGDLSDLQQTKEIATQVNRLGRMDGVIHNAGIYSGNSVMPVNIVAPFVLTALITRPDRLVYLSSGMHLGGHPNLEKIDFTGKTASGSYSDSKLFVTAFAAAIARMWKNVVSSSVNPGWVPTKMGGAGAPDDLRLGHLTQEWLVTSHDPKALESGGYWFHQHRQKPHPASQDVTFQNELISKLERVTDIMLPKS
jgi:NAD(P)-dependent dehydrogenase (short-subunit alcohol dehydrogenase family)